jgi:hydrogenase nickel incorporation protein HypB
LTRVKVFTNILKANDSIGQKNRDIFNKNKVYTINLMSSIAVVEGDLQTDKDAKRIEKYNIPVVQINTKGACHLDSKMVDRVLGFFNFQEINLLVIENVGNLVCPASFDFKPIKYPVMFRKAKVVLINKVDLLDYTNFNMAGIKKDALRINPHLKIFEISCQTGEGLDDWFDWLKEQVRKKRDED